MKFEPFPICKIKGVAEGHYLKGRSEVLIIKDADKVFISTKKTEVCSMNRPKEERYAVPGGGWMEREEHFETARREAEEEARLKTGHMAYATNYIELGGPEKDKKLVPRQYRWVGYYTEVFVADYAGHFYGRIDIQDRDMLIAGGEFVDIGKIYCKLHPAHQEALRKYLLI